MKLVWNLKKEEYEKFQKEQQNFDGMRKPSKTKRICAALVFVLLLLPGCSSVEEDNKIPDRVYNCDYHSLSFHTEITTVYEGSEISISGNLLTFIADPLTAKGEYGNVIGYAGDTYGFVEQDSHGIYVDDEFDVNMCGKVDLFGNTYALEDADGNVVANLSFNAFGTYGSITDANGNVIAEYSSLPMINDYTVSVYENGVCSDLSILMIMASYVSDFIADGQ